MSALDEEETEVFEDAVGSDQSQLSSAICDSDVRRLVLRYHLGSLLIANEFNLYFGETAGFRLTTQKLPTSKTAVSYEGPPLPPHTTVTGAPFTLPPLVRHFYSRWIRNIPWIAGHSLEYLQVFDEFTDSAFRSFVVSWLRATKFDLLGFAKHYYAVFLFGYNDPTDPQADYNTCCPPLDGQLPQGFQEFKDAVISQLASTETHSGRFTTYPTSTNDVHSADYESGPKVRNQVQEVRYRQLSAVFRDFLTIGADLLVQLMPEDGDGAESDDGRSKSYGPKLFAIFKTAETLDELPELLQDWTRALARAVAVGFENILDDKGWRGKARRVWNKMPLSLVVTSLRLINPVPFVETLLRIFVWKPPGGLYSLLQSLAGVICSLSKTRAEVKDLKAKLLPQDRIDIEHIINTLWGTDGEISSVPEDEKRVLEALREAGITVNETYRDSNDEESNLNTRYARLLIRHKEKLLFIDCLGSDELTGFIVHIIKFLPPVLKELWDCIQMADLLQSFFDTLTNMLEIIGRYDAEEEVDLERDSSESDAISVATTTITKRPPTTMSSYASSIASSLYKSASFANLNNNSPINTLPTTVNQNDADSIHSSYGHRFVKQEVSLEMYHKTITKLEACILEFCKTFYPALHKLASRNSTGMVGMHEIVDWMIKEFGAGMKPFDRWPKDSGPQPTRVYSDGKECILDISAYDAAESVVEGVGKWNGGVGLESLWVEVDSISMGLLVSGVDEHGWIREDVSKGGFRLEDGLLGNYGVVCFREELIKAIGDLVKDDPSKYLNNGVKKSSSILNMLGVSRPGSSESSRSSTNSLRSGKKSWW
ncbi:UNVERIFIED_CONTAM: hypothetical protein HDU68_004112 [Siphonaria sp. JEL0065]|nr:hypothetical protein HDU68_004112 [Siphonaria sp. JEL0065]